MRVIAPALLLSSTIWFLAELIYLAFEPINAWLFAAYVRSRFLVGKTNRIGQSADSVTINAIEFVQALKGDDSMTESIAELEHDLDGIERPRAASASFDFSRR